MSRYLSSHAERANYQFTILCRMLAVARSAYYAWTRRGVSARAQAEVALAAQIAALYERSRRTYGAPRVHADRRAAVGRCARQRVARLLRAAGLVGCHRHRRVCTTVADPAHAPVPNLVAHDLATPTPDRLWLGDIPYLPTGAGWRYLAVLLDAHSRRMIGWAMAERLRTERALDALAMALQARRPARSIMPTVGASTRRRPSKPPSPATAWCVP